MHRRLRWEPDRVNARRGPFLNALRAFEVAARSANFTRAAQELGVSQAAVSQQVKSLEANLGFKLFSRDGKRLVITSAGDQYLAVIRDALDRIAVGTDRLLQSKPSSILIVTTSPAFGAKWLVHRLGRFAAACPEIDLRVSATTSKSTLSRSMWTLRSVMAMGTGRVSMPLRSVRSGSCRFAAPNFSLAAIALPKRPTS
jgi:DNA-binding transcriptional LysR family regulator